MIEDEFGKFQEMEKKRLEVERALIRLLVELHQCLEAGVEMGIWDMMISKASKALGCLRGNQ
jgi:hypothetical protein